MIVHKVNVRNGGKYGYMTPSRRLPRPSDGYLDSARTARALGTTKDVVHQLADDGYLPAEDDDADQNKKWVSIDDLQQFVQKLLTPVTVETVEVPAVPANVAAAMTAPATDARPTRTNPAAARNGKPATAPSAPVATTDDDSGYDLVADCPECNARFGVDSGVLRCKCPSCGSILDVDQESQEPEVPETAAKPVATNPGALARLFGYHSARQRD